MSTTPHHAPTRAICSVGLRTQVPWPGSFADDALRSHPTDLLTSTPYAEHLSKRRSGVPVPLPGPRRPGDPHLRKLAVDAATEADMTTIADMFEEAGSEADRILFAFSPDELFPG